LSLSLSSYGSGSAQEPARPKGVLVLIWNGKDDPKNAPLEKGIQEGLGSAPAGSYEYYPEYLEDNRFPEEKQSLAMRDYLREKYGNDRIGVILAPTTPSLNFLLKYRGELFPKTPIVFHTSDRAKADNKADANSVAVLVDNPYRNTIDMALKLQPDTGEVLIIAGEKDHSMKSDLHVRNWLKEFEDKGVKLTSLSDLNLDQLIAKVKSAPEHSIILYVKYSQEELKTLDLPNSLTLIAAAARVPVYTVGDILRGRGSVGGHTVSIEDCGKVIGETALRVINGARPQDMQVVPVPTRPIIDWRQLRRWGINKDLAPAGTFFEYKEPTFWEEYKWWIIGSISFSVIQTLLIVALSLQRARRKKIEVALGEKELRLREAQAIAHMGSFHWDVIDDSLAWSDELYRIYGLEPGKSRITYKTYLESVHPDHREQVGRSLEQAMTARRLFEHEYRIVRSDGETRWISTHGRPIFDADWTLIAMQGVCQDITDRKRAEEALRESEERARRTLVEQMLAGVVECDAGGKFMMVNQRYCDITGYTEAELRGMVINDITHPDDLPNCIKLFGRLLETGDSFVCEKRYLRKDGSEVWVNNNVSPVYDADGKIEKAVAVVTDITDRKRAESEREQLLKQEKAARAEAQAANQSKDEFLTVVSHELRSPLNSILGYARLLRTRPSDVSQIKQTVEIIERNGRMQLQLIEDLLDTARIISGKLKLEVSPVALVSIVTAAIEAVRPAAQAKSIEMVSHIDPRAGQITGDPGRLQQVVWNLLSNAIKFTPQSGRVELRMESVDHHVRITVSDTGKGIEPEFLPFVFDRFRQSDSSSARRFGGLGLGLSLVKQLVELHGGTVEAVSDGPGCGATFRVTLPQSPTKIGGAVPQQPRAVAQREVRMEGAIPLDEVPSLDGVSVLVVDDQEEARQLLSETLSECGAQVTAVSSSIEALAIIADPPHGKRPSVLILDINMPVEDGYKALEKVRSFEAEQGVPQSDQIPAIALTALGRSEDRLKALAAGFRMHVAKPVEPAELAMVIASLADRLAVSRSM
ncbi:MAG TPA: PAS domain S-box protein, partial [Blastocatellia bacterium]|nr:PAS domain S-box protein [Blastocatellia bacterium]